MLEKLVDVLYVKDKRKLIEAVTTRCPSFVGLEDVGCVRNFDADYNTAPVAMGIGVEDCGEVISDDGNSCKRCWEIALEESEYADFIKI